MTTTLNRRSFVARSGAALAATSALGGLLASRARAAAPTAGLPDPKAVLALGKPLLDHEVVELASLLQAGEITSVALTTAYLDRIEARNGAFETYADNGKLNAFVRIDRTGALEQAAAADARLAAARADGGTPAPLLCGIPVGYQDVFAVDGQAATAGTPAFAGNVAVQDAVAVARLRAMGTVQIGLTSCSPFGDGVEGAVGRNPWDATTTPGGGAEGSAIAPVAGLVAATLARDSGGQATVPAAVCGASAIVPSTGLVPTAGVVPDVPGLDAVAPLARSVRDASLLLNALLGPDLLADPVSNAAVPEFPLIPIVPRTTDRPLAGVTVGVPTADPVRDGASTYVGDPRDAWDAAWRDAFVRFTGELEKLGATVKVLTAPSLDLALGEAAILGARAEVRHTVAVQAFADGRPTDQVAALTERYGRAPAGGGAKTLAAAIAAENAVTIGARHAAELARRETTEQVRASLADQGVDVLALLTVAGPVGAKGAAFPPRRAGLAAANVLGWPSVTLPIGAAGALPISVTLLGPRFSEPELVQAAVDYQDRHPEWHTRRPEEKR